MQREFREAKKSGRELEEAIARILVAAGWAVIPVTASSDVGIGPRVMSKDGTIVAPDLICFRKGRCRMVETKNKSTFSLHRNTGTWLTGIDTKHFNDYDKVQTACGCKLCVVFLQRPEGDSPSGVYFQWVDELKQHVHHSWDENGMTYWAEKDLSRMMDWDTWTLNNIPMDGLIGTNARLLAIKQEEQK